MTWRLKAVEPAFQSEGVHILFTSWSCIQSLYQKIVGLHEKKLNSEGNI